MVISLKWRSIYEIKQNNVGICMKLNGNGFELTGCDRFLIIRIYFDVKQEKKHVSMLFIHNNLRKLMARLAIETLTFRREF